MVIGVTVALQREGEEGRGWARTRLGEDEGNGGGGIGPGGAEMPAPP